MTNQKSSWQQHIDQVTEKGLLAKQLYVILTEPASDMDAVFANLQEHLSYQLELERTGVMFAAGPFSNDQGTEWDGEGMVIIRAESIEQAKQIAENDPMHISGARKYRVRPWLLNEGSITLKVTYSNGKREVI